MALTPSIELAVPFRIGPDGAPATVSDPNVIIRQHVLSIVGTQRGERLMKPQYGVNVQRFLYAQNDSSTAALLDSEIKEAIQQWEPDVKFQTATMVSDENVAHLSVQYQSVASSNPSQAVTVNVNAMGQ